MSTEYLINTFYTQVKDQDLTFYFDADEYKICVVLDGHGKNGNEFVNKIKDKVIEKVKSFDFSQPLSNQINTMCITIDDELKHPMYNYTGSTMTLVFLSNNKMIVVNIGDSDVYIQTDVLTKLSSNTSLIEKNEHYRITQTSNKSEIVYDSRAGLDYETKVRDIDGNLVPRNSKFHYVKNRMGDSAIYLRVYSEDIKNYQRLNMGRSIGDYFLKQYGVSNIPDIQEYPRPPKGSQLLIASDGFWDSWTLGELQETLQDPTKRFIIHQISNELSKKYFGDGNGDDNSLIHIIF